MVSINKLKIADVSYVINLDKRIDRLKNIQKQFYELNIEGVQRFSAIDNLGSGPLNCKQSHYKVYEEFLKTDGDVLLVLEDDCLFLDPLKFNYNEIVNEINSTDWDLYWLGCRNRRSPVFYKNKSYKVSSVSHAQSYLIKRNLCEYILKTYPINIHLNTAIDELLCLLIYGYEVTSDPNKFNFYQLDNPLNHLPTIFTSLCYEKSLSSQYASYSDLQNMEVNYTEYIKNSHPVNNE
jgi:GR25 family glycosyltransferase involved in LPS biosynthesis